ncbi:hypothetical protein DFA_04075 [Cavenderia fasciculata]|uniref:Uncharacterized protein n=1 Tax=Cavenderia fasciculata TaxID=261658 RepID=F4Q180_CACFS|nr:uncharacterized protein DFA_04075 [Cavenderia fasciculata]EGG18581.1 hypothetical protein DFA_04075 [Cavenderia fasciculata]|eukprot:XP_004366485.1 hypothetical protein DFA_04075 [Cavenderia fasciculata]
MTIENEQNDIEAARKLYAIWEKVSHPLVQSSIPVYLTGRSPILFSINHGAYHKHNIISPPKASASLLLLDMFKKNDIKDMLLGHGNESLGTCSNIDSYSESIYKLTLGVPRLVEGVVNYLLTRDLNLPINEQKLRDHLRSDSIYSNELNPTYSWSPEMKLLYLELCRASIFKIPFSLDLAIDTEMWHIPVEMKYKRFNYAKFFQLFNVYLEQYPFNRRMAIVLIPPLTLSEIVENARENRLDSILKVGLQLQQYMDINSYGIRQTGIPFEDCVESIIYTRTNLGIEAMSMDWFNRGIKKEEPSQQTTTGSVAQLFLFLSDSWVGSTIWNPSSHISTTPSIKHFPKIVNSLKSVNWEGIKLGLVTNRTDGIELVHCDAENFGVLWSMAAPFTTYRSLSKSGSSDLFTKINDKLGIAWIVKDYKNSLPSNQVEKEINLLKNLPFSIRFVAVMISLSPPKGDTSYLGKKTKDILSIDGEHIADLYEVTFNIQMVVLTVAGLEYFFSKENYDFLKRSKIFE